MQLAGDRLLIRIDARESEYLINAVRYLYYLFEAVESSRIVCDEVLAQLDQKAEHSTPMVQVESISKSNPLEVVVVGAVSTVVLIAAPLIWLKSRWHKSEGNRGKSKQELAKGELLEEYVREKRLRNDRQEYLNDLITSGELRDIAIDSVAQDLRRPARPVGTLDHDRIDSLVEHQLLPSIRNLQGPAIRELEVETDVDLPSDPEEGDGAEPEGGG